MNKGKNASTIRLDAFENPEKLVENYMGEIETRRLYEILHTMLSEENESITHLSNTAYYDYSSISTEMLPLVDSFLPSIKQFQENIDVDINDISSIVENYSRKVSNKANKHLKLLAKKLELFLLKKCDIEVNRCREILKVTMKQFSKQNSKMPLHLIKVVHYCVIKVSKLKHKFKYFSDTIFQITTLNSDESTGNIEKCFIMCDNFIDELKELVLLASTNLLSLENSLYETEDLKHNSSLAIQCVFLLKLKNSFISKIKEYLNSKISELNPNEFEEDKLGFSNFIVHSTQIFDGKNIHFLVENMIFSAIICENKKYTEFIIDIYINGIVLHILETAEKELPNKVIPPTAPMDLYLYQLNSLVKFIEKSEFLIANFEHNSLSFERVKEIRFNILTCFRRSVSINNYSRKWNFCKYWNLLYRNILNRRINIRNEIVEFSKVYVYDNCKYWLKYTIEVIRQIRWILGTSSIQSNSPLPPSRFMVPLFSRCLYTSFSFLYDFANYIISFESVYNTTNNSPGTEDGKIVWSKKIKPEHLSCIILDVFSLKKWVRDQFLREIFHHIDIVNNEYLINDLKIDNSVINISEVKSTVESDLLNNGFFAHIDNNVIGNLIEKMSTYLNNQIISSFDSGLRAIPCLHRLTNSASMRSVDDKELSKTPSNYVENAKKPVELFLVFSSNAINSVINDLDKDTLHELHEFYFKLLSKTLELVFGSIRTICEKQITSSKNQFASLQKLAAQRTFETTNVLDFNAVIEQYSIDINFWIELTTKAIINFFNSINSDRLNQNIEILFKDKQSYIELNELLHG